MVNQGLRRRSPAAPRHSPFALLIASAMHSGGIKRKAERRAAIESALRTVAFEQAGMSALADALNGALAEPFAGAVELLSAVTGRVIVTGVGKSGHIGSKIAA